MPLNFDLAGKHYPPVQVVITPDQIERYARASGDPGPRYSPGADQVASPVFPVVPAFPLMSQAMGDPELGIENPLMIVHGEQEFVYHRPLRPHEPLVLTPSLERVEDKGRSATFVTKVAATTPGGEPVVDQYATIFVRGGGSGAERPVGERPAAPAKGEVVARFARWVDEGMPPRYAEASGDHNPIHLDPEVARAVGLPGVINHGLGTLSLVAGGLVEHLAGGDPTRLRRLRGRFTDMVLPGSDLSVTVWASEGGGYLFETSRPDGAVVVSGSLEVAAA